MNPIAKLIALFTKQERRRLVPITFAILSVSVLEIAGVGSLGPFMAVIADQTVIHRQPVLAFFYRLGHFQSDRAFVIFLGIAVFTVILVSTAFRMIVLYGMSRFVANRRYALGVRLFRQYLYQPYQFFLHHNSGELSKNLLAEVDSVINGVMRPIINIFIHGMLSLAIFVLLVVINPVVAVASFGIFGLAYALLYGVIRKRLSRHGKEVREANRLRFKTANEAFGGIKDVKILGKEPFFSYAYSVAAKRYAATQAANHILSTIPSQAIQSLAMGFAIALVIILLIVHGTVAEVLPLITVYAYAIMRMMPNLRGIFHDAVQMRYHSFTVDALFQDMTTLPQPPQMPDKKAMKAAPDVLPFTHGIVLQQLEYSYPTSREPVLKQLNLSISRNTSVAFVGATGCGKTTLVDVIMGLLKPTGGAILADETPVTSLTDEDTRKRVAAWQRNFGYVPQQIFLSDDTVAANIAFGLPQDMRDSISIERAARAANLHEFITTELPEGYDTVVGERGIRLSGGQRQRVGIARALYHDPNILVMDEATSALDSLTEDAVMEAIRNLTHTKTIILIAHRLTTVQGCDVIYLMEKGRIIAQGSYKELLENSPQFRAMAKVK
ncbi:ABC transporter ATP-binding protein [Treponema primitia]|uniref:ABC transporter ATP-binding protein n=1 Tax=Treponema primitia TaxID=88058 RepID=UPI000255555D|nr:ABC transporter ATP-binding protein [Treponema primitia]